MAAVIAWLGFAGQLFADPPLPAATVSGFPPVLPPVPQQSPRPPDGPGSVSAFLEGVNSPDGGVEIMLGEGRILTTKADIATGKKPALIAVGDPTVVDFAVVNSRQIRLVGLRLGVTDLSVTTSANTTYSFEIRVVTDLDVLRGQLRAIFPDASLKLAQIRDHIVVEGEARDSQQVTRIIETIKAYLTSVMAGQLRKISGQRPVATGAPGFPGARVPAIGPNAQAPEPDGVAPGGVSPELNPPQRLEATIPPPQIINLIHVPGSQQVLLKVRVAELNRRGMREIGADFLAIDRNTGAIIGTQIGGVTTQAVASIASRNITGAASHTATPLTTVFGIFEQAGFDFFLSALRRNALLRILAEPNLVAMNGQQASFLAGGEFPIPVPQYGGGGVAPTVTVQFKEFGVRLNFLPIILDGDVIRLSVDPEVSSIDFAIGATLVAGGSPVPGLNTRRAHTVVELRQGQTLAIAGLLQLQIDAETSRIPGLGDLPILGPFFSNTTNERQEKELVVLVTPYLVNSMHYDQVTPGPGEEVKEPNDLEFYLLNRIEGRTDRSFRSTTQYDDPLHVLRCFMKLENDHVRGQHGFCE
jgi:pilus assembly protein CpaC